jgi:hypothetical protein
MHIICMFPHTIIIGIPIDIIFIMASMRSRSASMGMPSMGIIRHTTASFSIAIVIRHIIGIIMGIIIGIMPMFIPGIIPMGIIPGIPPMFIPGIIPGIGPIGTFMCIGICIAGIIAETSLRRRGPATRA